MARSSARAQVLLETQHLIREFLLPKEGRKSAAARDPGRHSSPEGTANLPLLSPSVAYLLRFDSSFPGTGSWSLALDLCDPGPE